MRAISAARRRARSSPRVAMPTSATPSAPLLRSRISWAMRVTARRMSPCVQEPGRAGHARPIGHGPVVAHAERNAPRGRGACVVAKPLVSLPGLTGPVLKGEVPDTEDSGCPGLSNATPGSRALASVLPCRTMDVATARRRMPARARARRRAGAPFEFLRRRAFPPLPAFELPWQGSPAGHDHRRHGDGPEPRAEPGRGAAASIPADLVARHLAWFRSRAARHRQPDADGPPRVSGAPTPQRRPRPSGAIAGPRSPPGTARSCTAPPLGVAYAHRPGVADPGWPPRSRRLTHFDERCRTAVAGGRADRRRPGPGRRPRGHGRRGSRRRRSTWRAARSSSSWWTRSADARPVDGPDQGFCLFAAALGLQALLRGGPFEQELGRVVSLGGDTDTNAAVAGALLGAAVGLERPPQAVGCGTLAGSKTVLEREAIGLPHLARLRRGRGPLSNKRRGPGVRYVWRY